MINGDAAGLRVIRGSSGDRMSSMVHVQAHVDSRAVERYPAVQFGHLKFKWPAGWTTEASVTVQQLSAYQHDMGGARWRLKCNISSYL